MGFVEMEIDKLKLRGGFEEKLILCGDEGKAVHSLSIAIGREGGMAA